MKTFSQLAIALTSAAAILALIVAIAPHSTVIADEVSGEVYGVEILGLTKTATNLPEPQLATHAPRTGDMSAGD